MLVTDFVDFYSDDPSSTKNGGVLGWVSFGYIYRTGQILIMLLIWGLLLFLCPLWLKRYQYGPIEWVWRMLTHIRFIPLTKISK